MLPARKENHHLVEKCYGFLFFAGRRQKLIEIRLLSVEKITVEQHSNRINIAKNYFILLNNDQILAGRHAAKVKNVQNIFKMRKFRR